jgi:hypothetical protein
VKTSPKAAEERSGKFRKKAAFLGHRVEEKELQQWKKKLTRGGQQGMREEGGEMGDDLA